jgi:large subunit ribosomal protein L23
MNSLSVLKRIKKPVLSEKSSRMMSENNEYVFKVSANSTRSTVKRAVEVAFGVKVDRVNVLNMAGKKKRVGRYVGQKSDWKKVYVKLKPGFLIEIAGT